ncbi:MAG TPA: hypothetical protein VFU00_08795, partial [Gemmatimonadales bacterium]|nr:hypothetical protein [Gemmatimonadales bacterium]
MTKGSGALAARADELRRLIDDANEAYYVADAPIMPDAEYDRLFRELQAIEAAHPELATADSPTQRVGAEPASALVKHPHRRPMLSLANAFDAEELAAWEERNARLVAEVRTGGYTAEVKIDGAAVNLTYEAGRLVVGATRGNGVIGENVTANLRTIRDVPLALRGTRWPAVMEVRGEVYLPYENFKRINAEREREGIHLDHDTVGLEGEDRDERLEAGDGGLHVGQRLVALPVRLDLETPLLEQLELLPMGPRGQRSLDRFDREGEHAEPAPAGDGGIELAERPRR